MGQGIVIFCNRQPFNKDLEYIDFNDIISDKKIDNVDVIRQQLEDLSYMVIELYEKGVPLEAIINTLEMVLTGIEEENSAKTLKKCKTIKKLRLFFSGRSYRLEY